MHAMHALPDNQHNMRIRSQGLPYNSSLKKPNSVQVTCDHFQYQRFYGQGEPDVSLGRPGDTYVDITPSNHALYIRCSLHWHKHGGPTQPFSFPHPTEKGYMLSLGNELEGAKWRKIEGVVQRGQDIAQGNIVSPVSTADFLGKHLAHAMNFSQNLKKRRLEESEGPPGKVPRTETPPSLPQPITIDRDEATPPSTLTLTPTESPVAILPVAVASAGNRKRIHHYTCGPYALPVSRHVLSILPGQKRTAYLWDTKMAGEGRGVAGDIFFLLSGTREMPRAFYKSTHWQELPHDLHQLRTEWILHSTSRKVLSIATCPQGIWVPERVHAMRVNSSPSELIPTVSAWLDHLLGGSPFQLRPMDHTEKATQATHECAENAVPANVHAELQSRYHEALAEIRQLQEKTPLPIIRTSVGVGTTPIDRRSTGVATIPVITNSIAVGTTRTSAREKVSVAVGAEATVTSCRVYAEAGVAAINWGQSRIIPHEVVTKGNCETSTNIAIDKNSGKGIGHVLSERGTLKYCATGTSAMDSDDTAVSSAEETKSLKDAPIDKPFTGLEDKKDEYALRTLFRHSQKTGEYLCRMCLYSNNAAAATMSFPARTPIANLRAHGISNHKSFWECLQTLTETQVKRIGENFRKKEGLGG